MQTFHQWLEHSADDPSAAENLATLIASASAAGVSYDRLRRLVRLPPETLQDILKGLVATGQVVMLQSFASVPHCRGSFLADGSHAPSTYPLGTVADQTATVLQHCQQGFPRLPIS